MKLLVTSTILIGAISGCAAQPISSQCAHDRNAMLALDERAFDQDLSNGGGGWRRIGNIPGCEAAAADLIAAYAAAHPGSSTMLAWHEGQMRAGAGQYSRAIPLLQAARKDPAMDRAGWNHYVDATVAFLRRDMAALAAARAKLQAVPYQPAEGLPPLTNGYVEFPAQPGQPAMRFRWPPNIEAVDGLIACFDKPYSEAYEQACRDK